MPIKERMSLRQLYIQSFLIVGESELPLTRKEIARKLNISKHPELIKVLENLVKWNFLIKKGRKGHDPTATTPSKFFKYENIDNTIPAVEYTFYYFPGNRAIEELLHDLDVYGVPAYKYEPKKIEQTDEEPTIENKYVYIIRGYNDWHKIGHSKDPQTRLFELQSSNPVPLLLVYACSIANASNVEKQIHEHYAAKRGMGEWFSLSQQEVYDICRWLELTKYAAS